MLVTGGVRAAVSLRTGWAFRAERAGEWPAKAGARRGETLLRPPGDGRPPRRRCRSVGESWLAAFAARTLSPEDVRAVGAVHVSAAVAAQDVDALEMVVARQPRVAHVDLSVPV